MELFLPSTTINTLLPILAVIAALFVITTQNPIYSVLNLIVLYILVAFYLIFKGITYIGLSYVIIYVGAIAILFLFILMMIDLEIVEKRNNNYLPLLTLLFLGSVFLLKNIVVKFGFTKYINLNTQSNIYFNQMNNSSKTEFEKLFNLDNLNIKFDDHSKLLSNDNINFYTKIKKIPESNNISNTSENSKSDNTLNIKESSNLESQLSPDFKLSDKISDRKYYSDIYFDKLNKISKDGNKDTDRYLHDHIIISNDVNVNVKSYDESHEILPINNYLDLDIKMNLPFEINDISKSNLSDRVNNLKEETNDNLLEIISISKYDNLHIHTEITDSWILNGISVIKDFFFNEDQHYMVFVPDWENAVSRITQISAIGDILYSVYHSYIYILSAILLLSMVGAILLTAEKKEEIRIIPIIKKKSFIPTFLSVTSFEEVGSEGIVDSLSYFVFVVLFINFILFGVNTFLSLSMKYLDKEGGFECGFTSFMQTRERFNIVFYRVALLFLIFDLEIILIFPYTAINHNNQSISKNNVLAFLYILIVGFIFELKEGALEIVKKVHSIQLNIKT